jgi:ABC-type multidrug transport system fused ATPase/permease subunit
LVEEETAETSSVKFAIYHYYARSIGFHFAVWSFILYGLFQASSVGANVWLSLWSQDAGDDDSKEELYLSVYGAFGVVQSLSVLSAVIILALGGVRASGTLHRQMLERVLASTMAFFDTTPVGRIVNRFSKDMDEVDVMIPMHVKDILSSFFSVVGTLFVVCYASPIIIALLVPMALIFLFLQSSYLAVSRQLKRMISISRSPINSSLTESFAGASTIRAYAAQEDFTLRNDEKLEHSQRFSCPEVSSGSWLFCRLQAVANLLIIFTSLLAVIFRESAEPGLVGLSLTYALNCQLDTYLLTR